MSNELSPAQAFAILKATQMPGFGQALMVLDKLAQQIKDSAFESNDDSRALRLLHEGRGAGRLVREFKAALKNLTEGLNENS